MLEEILFGNCHAGSEAAVRFSIFELLGWTAFLAVLFALLSRASWQEATIVLAWLAAIILALKFAGRRPALITSLAVAGALTVYVAFAVAPTMHHVDGLEFTVFNFLCFAVFGWIIWGIVILTDAAIAYLGRCLR